MDKKTIIKIANLAKLEIKDDKLNDIASSLEKILNLVDEMNDVDLSLIHISEPTRLGMISYAVFCLKKKKLAP